jgi:predicted enzyme related to lactoylglutathione lyase
MSNATAIAGATGIDAHYYLAKDLQRAIAFYRDVIGLKVAREFSEGIEFDLGDGSTFGISHMPDEWFPGGGVIFAFDDLEAIEAKLRETGVRFYTDGVINTPVCNIAWCEDPEGNTFAIHMRK